MTAAERVLAALDASVEVRKPQVQQAGSHRAEVAGHSVDAGGDGLHLEPGRGSAPEDRPSPGASSRIRFSRGLRGYFEVNPPPGTRLARMRRSTLAGVMAVARNALTRTPADWPSASTSAARLRKPARYTRRQQCRSESLPSELVDQIAAGEVIERPASVVKELVENSLDAGASRIDIDVERGGIGLVRVRDDGAAFPRTNCRSPSRATPPARSPRSTISKPCRRWASAARRCRRSARWRDCASSRIQPTQNTPRRSTWTAAPSRTVRPAAHPAGTTIEVRDLFFNVPARRKFVRSDATEVGHIARLAERLALVALRRGVPTRATALACCSMRRRRARRQSMTTLDVDALNAVGAARIRAVLGEEFIAQCRAGSPFRRARFRSTGWIGLPTAARAQPDQQFWFVNGRSVRDRLLMNAVRLAYRDVLYGGRHAAYVLYLTLDPRLVDVNAHPAKLEVRFRDSRQMHDFVFRAVERTLAATKPNLAGAPAAAASFGARLRPMPDAGACGGAVLARCDAPRPHRCSTRRSARCRALSPQAHVRSARCVHAIRGTSRDAAARHSAGLRR